MNTPPDGADAHALPTITIVTPSYQQAAYLARTLESVHSQGYPALEHIVIDGGSTDGSADVIRAYAPKLAYWESTRDRGQSHALNKGFARATGQVLTWLNSDDVLMPGALHAVGAVFAAFPAVHWLTGQPMNISADDVLAPFPLKTGRFRALIRRGLYHGRALGFIRQEGTFWRRALWEQAGGSVDEARHYTMDAALWMRFADCADLYTLDRALAAYRVHAAQKTADLDRYYAEWGVRVPGWVRPLAVPVRAAFTLAAWPFAPRIVQAGGGWQVRGRNR
jgi:glycosyltransferase involved in cell wall biosynthesis